MAQHSYLKEDYPVPHEMTVDEIKSVLKEFRTGAENAKKAGFDGIELNAANGFLVNFIFLVFLCINITYKCIDKLFLFNFIIILINFNNSIFRLINS